MEKGGFSDAIHAGAYIWRSVAVLIAFGSKLGNGTIRRAVCSADALVRHAPIRKTGFIMPGRVNYDAIASTYNRRFQGQSRNGTLLALEGLVQALRADRVLEVGCGTGHWLAGLSGLIPGVYGLDFTAGMLAQAQQQAEPLALIQGRAEELPFPVGSFDLVYCVNAIHHFQQPENFIGQARRALRPGGALAVIGMVPHRHREDWYIYRYFDGTFETDLARFPSWGEVLEWMFEAGLERMELSLVEEIVNPKYGAAVLEDPFLAKNACSQLALLSEQAYAVGLSRIRCALAEAEAQGEALVFQNTIRIHQLVGWTKGV
jgi:ubiquinone/menaquinone biosynthesis C-methylase UbiE